MPTLALATPAYGAQSSLSLGGGFRRIPGYNGYEGEVADEGGKYWLWDGEEWIEQGAIPVGATKIESGITYRWNGSSWDIVGDQQDPGLPVGNTPWLLFLLLSIAYLFRKRTPSFFYGCVASL